GVLDLVQPAADLEERVEAHRIQRGWFEAPNVTELTSPAGGKSPVFFFDVVNENRVGPSEQRRDDEPNAFATARGGEAEHVLGSIVPNEAPERTDSDLRHSSRAELRAIRRIVRLAENDTGVTKEAGLAHLGRRCPARTAVCDAGCLPSASCR